MTQSKRFVLTVVFSALNFAIFGVGMFLKTDLTALGTGLSLINAPLYAYILGQTIRKSEPKTE